MCVVFRAATKKIAHGNVQGLSTVAFSVLAHVCIEFVWAMRGPLFLFSDSKRLVRATVR